MQLVARKCGALLAYVVVALAPQWLRPTAQRGTIANVARSSRVLIRLSLFLFGAAAVSPAEAQSPPTVIVSFADQQHVSSASFSFQVHVCYYAWAGPLSTYIQANGQSLSYETIFDARYCAVDEEVYAVTATLQPGQNQISIDACDTFSGCSSAYRTVYYDAPSTPTTISIAPRTPSFTAGQGGPGGVPAPAFWLRADTLVTQSGGVISAIGDASGRGRNTTSPVNHRPTLVANGFNGRPTIRFSQSTWLDVSGAISSQAVPIPFAIFTVFQRSAAQVAASSWQWQRVFSGWTGDPAHEDWQPSPPNYPLNIGLDASGNPQFIAPVVDLFKTTNASYALSVARIGDHAKYTGGTQQSLTGDISEMIVYDRVLSAAEEARVKSYLDAKWGMATDPALIALSVLDQNGMPMSGLSINWSSKNSGVVTVAGSGQSARLSPIAAGSAYVVAATTNGVRDSILVTVSSPPGTPLTVSITPRPIALEAGASASVHAVVRNQFNATMPGESVTWTSSAASVATVASTGALSGTVTAAAQGTALILARASNGAVDTTRVTVTPAACGCSDANPEMTATNEPGPRTGILLIKALGGRDSAGVSADAVQQQGIDRWAGTGLPQRARRADKPARRRHASDLGGVREEHGARSHREGRGAGHLSRAFFSSGF